MDVRIVYSPTDAIKLAKANPNKHVMFFAIGFETTAPSTALTLQRAKTEGLSNFSVFCNHVTIIPAIRAILDSPDMRLDGFIGPGHCSTVIGCASSKCSAMQRRCIPMCARRSPPRSGSSGIQGRERRTPRRGGLVSGLAAAIDEYEHAPHDEATVRGGAGVRMWIRPGGSRCETDVQG
jgi:hypothetical protein